MKQIGQINPIKLVHMLHMTSHDLVDVFPLCEAKQVRQSLQGISKN